MRIINRWTVLLYTVEVCSRGIIPSKCISKLLEEGRKQKLLAHSRADVKELLQNCSEIVINCSNWIWKGRHTSDKLSDGHPLQPAMSGY